MSAKTTREQGDHHHEGLSDRRASDAAILLPASVSVAMADIAATMREGLPAMAVGAGLSVMQSLMDESVTEICGPKGKHRPGREAVRHGTEDGVGDPRRAAGAGAPPVVRAADGSGEIGVAAYELFDLIETVGRDGDGPACWPNCPPPLLRFGLEPVGAEVDNVASATSKSAVLYVGSTPPPRPRTLRRPARRGSLRVRSGCADDRAGVHFGEHLCVVALGIGIDGTKHPPGGGRRSRPRTPPWSPICSWGCGTGAWT